VADPFQVQECSEKMRKVLKRTTQKETKLALERASVLVSLNIRIQFAIFLETRKLGNHSPQKLLFEKSTPKKYKKQLYY
jgi:hypothetical protein